MTRIAHLVGSIPLASPEEAMAAGLERLGPNLRWLPDGETGERRNWIIHIIESFRRHPDLEIKREGDWSDYDATPVFAIRKGHTLTGESLDFGHADDFAKNYPTFLKLREQYGHDDLAYQLGLPGDFDMALFTLGPLGAFRHRRPFTEANLRTIRTVHEQAGDDVVFQVEVPAELVFVAKMPLPLQPLMAAFLARGLVALAAESPEGARFGVHLCLGDMNHRALGRMSDVSPLVHLANAIAAKWPAGRPLDHPCAVRRGDRAAREQAQLLPPPVQAAAAGQRGVHRRLRARGSALRGATDAAGLPRRTRRPGGRRGHGVRARPARRGTGAGRDGPDR